MKKFVTIIDRFSLLLASGSYSKPWLPTAKPMGIPILPGAPLMATQSGANIPHEVSTFCNPASSRGDRRVAKASAAHWIRYAVLGTGNGFVTEAESNLELRNLFVMNAQLNALSVCEQVKFTSDLNPNNRDHHIFDLVVDLPDGSCIAA